MTEWDGQFRSYLPPAELRIDPGLKLHRGGHEEVDPITYEVIRHRLWTINEEHGITIEKASGSYVALYGHDFNPCMLLEDGEFLFFGPYIQFQSGMVDLTTKWTLENRSTSPGIRDGDMYLSNDPWVGTMHQQDAMMMCPVFVDGELFCWVANVLHHQDIGGNTPGSFCPDAASSFEEGTAFPPHRIVEDGKLREDLADSFSRQSRIPHICALDLRAMVAGNTVARRAVLELVDEYGKETVKSAMRKIVDVAEQRFLNKLRRLPDGEWKAEQWIEVATEGDRETHHSVMTVTKEGETLTFSNRGTDPQVGALNITFAGWRGGVLAVINSMMNHDVLYAVGGAMRHIKFDPEPGTITCADHPASVSNGGIIGVMGAMNLTHLTLGKLLAHDPELQQDAMAISASVGQWAATSIAGVNQWGHPFATILLDGVSAGVGAFPHRDGIDTGGYVADPLSLMPNVEFCEFQFPVLYLYRREQQDSGGAGRQRGGNAPEICFVPHGTDQLIQATNASGLAIPAGEGLFGGFPGSPNRYVLKRNTNLAELFAAGKMPTSLDEVEGDEELLPPKRRNIIQGPSDIYELRYHGAGGYGDPLDRKVEAVQRDVSKGSVSTQVAERFYGVVIDADGTVDAEATAALRAKRRAERGGSETEVERPDRPAVGNLQVEDGNWVCARCSHSLGAVTDGYRSFANERVLPVAEIAERTAPPQSFIDDNVVAKEHSCPNCGGLFNIAIMAEGKEGSVGDRDVILNGHS